MNVGKYGRTVTMNKAKPHTVCYVTKP